MQKTMKRQVWAAALAMATLLVGGVVCAEGPREKGAAMRASVPDAGKGAGRIADKADKPADRPSATEAKPGKAAKGAAAADGIHDSAAVTTGGVVNVNEASAEQLAMLPGVGPSRASAIVAYRKSHPFKRIEELTRVKGIGKKTFGRLRPLISLSGPTTMSERPGHHVRANT